MKESQFMDLPAPDLAASVVAIDQECMQCGYNLRGLSATGRCPECGQFVHQSMRGDLLRYANPEWLRKIKLGLNLMYHSIVLTIFAGIVIGTIMVATGVMLPWLLTVVRTVSGFCSYLALFLVTIQEPRVSLAEKQVTWRRVVRTLAIANFTAVLITQTPFLVARMGAVFFNSVVIAQGLLGLVLVFAYFAYAESFAPRIPDAKLARSTRILKWGMAAVQALGVIIFSLRVIGGATVNTATLTASVISGYVLGLITLVFGLWALAVLSRYRNAFTLAVQEATTIVEPVE
jgi:hypothetical protein